MDKDKQQTIDFAALTAAGRARQTACTTPGCSLQPAVHFHRLDRTWYCEACAREIQGRENTMDQPIELFREFWQPGYSLEKI